MLGCIRIYHRKIHDREPTGEEIEKLAGDKKRLEAIRGQLSEEDVMSAFGRGEEVRRPQMHANSA